MHCFRKFFAAAGCLVIGVTCMAVAQEGKPAEEKGKAKQEKVKSGKKDKEKEKEKKKGEGAKPEEEKGKLSLPLAKGEESKGITIPFHDSQGRQKTMQFTIGTANKLDDDQVRMAKLLIETFDETGKREMTIDIPSSVMNLSSKTIVTNTEEVVTIRREDFELTGQQMTFNTETKTGNLKGNVRMLLYDLRETAAPSEEKPSAANPDQGEPKKDLGAAK